MPKAPSFLPTDRRAASTTGLSVAPGKWPVITKSYLARALESPRPDDNPQVLALARARVEIHHAVMHTARALSLWHENLEMRVALGVVEKLLKEAEAALPLEVK